MSIEGHGLSTDQFIALARGGGGAAAIGSLVTAQHSRHLTLLRATRNDASAVTAYNLLARAERLDPAAVSTVVRYPSVGAWALHTLRGDRSVPGATPAGLAAVAAAAAIRAGLPAQIEVPAAGGMVMLPSLGAVEASGPTAIVATSPAEIRWGGKRVTVQPGEPGWMELRRIRAGELDGLVDDLDPFRMPATDGVPTGRLTAHELAELESMLRAAWVLLDPASAAEIAAIVQVIVPYQGPDEGYVSTSSPEAFGSVAMSRQPDQYTCAATLVHETQHLKLCALLDLVRLTRPDDGPPSYYAPWRADPRPASALLQGAYAFFGVTRFWRRQRIVAPDDTVRQRADIEFAHWRDAAALAAETLKASGQLTDAGRAFTAEMAQVLASYQQEPVSSHAAAAARVMAAEHRARWHADNDAPASTPGTA